MLNRAAAVLYVLAALWLAVVWYFFSRVEPSIGPQAFMVALVGAPPLLIVLIVDYIAGGGRNR